MNQSAVLFLLSALVACALANISGVEDFETLCVRFPGLAECQELNVMEKRKSAYMRFGRSAPDDEITGDMDKRKSAYMRFGKRSESAEPEFEAPQEMEKRKSAYMRFGKRKSAYMRFGKRSDEFEDSPLDMEKRKSAYMRFGK